MTVAPRSPCFRPLFHRAHPANLTARQPPPYRPNVAPSIADYARHRAKSAVGSRWTRGARVSATGAVSPQPAGGALKAPRGTRREASLAARNAPFRSSCCRSSAPIRGSPAGLKKNLPKTPKNPSVRRESRRERAARLATRRGPGAVTRA